MLPALLPLMSPTALGGLTDFAARAGEVSEGGAAVSPTVFEGAPSAGCGTEEGDSGLSLLTQLLP